ncbi:MAG: hypothetical protein ACT4N5_03010 [Nitrosopumilaceae archaeon]
MNEVYRLHFDYGYSARKIAELMKVNRHTIDGDLDYWYSRVTKHYNLFNPEHAVIFKLERMETQRTRLRDMLDRTQDISEKITIERLIFDLESKMINTDMRLTESIHRVHTNYTNMVNDYLKKHGHQERFMTFADLVSLPNKSHEKIKSIINAYRKGV